MTTQAEMRVTRRRVTKAKGRQLPAEPRKRRGPPWRLIHVVESQRSGPRRRRDWRCPMGVSKQLDTYRMRWLASFYSKAAEMVKPVGVMLVSGDGHWVDADQLPSVLTLRSSPSLLLPQLLSLSNQLTLSLMPCFCLGSHVSGQHSGRQAAWSQALTCAMQFSTSSLVNGPLFFFLAP